MRPFLISAVAVSCVGYLCVPLFRSLKLQSVIRKEGPARHSSKKGTATMGGLYFIPIGVIVAEIIVGFSSLEVLGASAATLTFAAIGLLDDLISMRNNNVGLSARFRIILEVSPFFFVLFENHKFASCFSGVDGTPLWHTGCCWVIFLLLAVCIGHIITLQHVYILVTNFINLFMMVTHKSILC